MQSTLTSRQRQAAEQLAAGFTSRQVGKAIDVHEVTVCRWHKLPEFRKHLAGLIELSEQDAMDMLHSLKKRATVRLAELMDNASPNIALRAAEAVLDRTRTPYQLDRAPDPLADSLNMYRVLDR